MNEPENGFLLCGPVDNQQLYARDDAEARANASTRSGHTIEHRWFHVADGSDIYRFEDLLRDYGLDNITHLVACADDWRHGCLEEPAS